MGEDAEGGWRAGFCVDVIDDTALLLPDATMVRGGVTPLRDVPTLPPPAAAVGAAAFAVDTSTFRGGERGRGGRGYLMWWIRH